MTDWGSHGSGTDDEIITSLVAWGAGVVESSANRTINQVDLAPLMAALLGCVVPLNSVGILPLEMLDAPLKYRFQAARANLRQMREQYFVKRDERLQRSLPLLSNDPILVLIITNTMAMMFNNNEIPSNETTSNEKETEIQKLRDEYNSLLGRTKELEDGVKVLYDTINLRNIEKRSLRAQLTRSTAKVESALWELEQISKTFEETKAKADGCEEAEKAIASLLEEKALLADRFKELSADKELMVKDNGSLSELVAHLQNKIKALKKENADRLSETNKLQSQISAYTAQRKHDQKEIHELSEAFRVLEVKVQKCETVTQEKTERLSKQVKDQQKEKDDILSTFENKERLLTLKVKTTEIFNLLYSLMFLMSYLCVDKLF